MRAGKPYSLLIAIASLALLSPTAVCSDAPADLDEIEVIGKTLRTLQAEANAAEDRYYRRFNELNEDDRFDVICERHKALGTKIPKRECRAQMFTDITTRAAEDFFEGMREGAPRSTAFRSTWGLADIQAEYRKVVNDTIARNPELIRLAGDVEVTRRRYAAALREREKGALARSSKDTSP